MNTTFNYKYSLAETDLREIALRLLSTNQISEKDESRLLEIVSELENAKKIYIEKITEINKLLIVCESINIISDCQKEEIG